jgi:1,3-beta-glucanosyltransferase GAS1
MYSPEEFIKTSSLILQGSHFFYANGSQFFIRGLYYIDSGRSAESSSTYMDTLTDTPRCTRDLPYFVQLGVNTIGVFGIDSRWKHSQCMNILAEAGIYVLVALTTKTSNIPRTFYQGQNVVSLDYNTYDDWIAIIDEFQGYPNTLGFYFARSGLGLGASRVSNMVLEKAFLRDMKEDIKEKGHRNVPIGFDIDHLVANFMNCGDKSTSPDFIKLSVSYNFMNECPYANEEARNMMIEDYRGFDIPLFFDIACVVNLTENFGGVETNFSNMSLEVFFGVAVDGW